MIRLSIRSIVLLTAGFFSTQSQAQARTDLLEIALETKQQISKRMDQCGTSTLNPNDPILPPPRIQAHEALANLQVPYLFGYYQRLSSFGGNHFKWKRPNGGLVARMSVEGDSALSFTLSLGGQQAHMNSYRTPQGEFFNYWCGSRRVNERAFRMCVENRWVKPLLRQFCR